jgi:hypothetical protein
MRERDSGPRGFRRRTAIPIAFLVAGGIFAAGTSESREIQQKWRGRYYAGLLEDARQCSVAIGSIGEGTAEEVPRNCQKFESEFIEVRDNEAMPARWVYKIPDSAEFMAEQSDHAREDQEVEEFGIMAAAAGCAMGGLFLTYRMARWSRYGQD